eukprot:CAMPEP_0184456584 /NCGR_PEP_ID=MMETSP0740-20130409/27300_1 /TAXON_ID=385413 /ORGANISM="Thalassiosira miniscula, Strain CCMP1093" /LENGTH=41 /DNA_ID= /DNA_START= /DNA_END= /DNA_ORIENTATION=
MTVRVKFHFEVGRELAIVRLKDYHMQLRTLGLLCNVVDKKM